MTSKSSWVNLAAASGACAAFNGVFAKLTTTELTTSWAGALSAALGFERSSKFTEFVVRATFFLLNLSFNALMWALFTAALSRGSSSTRVSIINTSSNFVLTALLGFAIFQESLPLLWWVGASGLVVGTVVIGKREQEDKKENTDKKATVVGEIYRDQVVEGKDSKIGDGIELDETEGTGARGMEGPKKAMM